MQNGPIIEPKDIAEEKRLRNYHLAQETIINIKAVQPDFFTKPKSMKQRVLEFAKMKGFINSVDLEQFSEQIRHKEGVVKGLLRIHREARQLAEDGRLRRLDDKEKTFRGMRVKYATYEFVK